MTIQKLLYQSIVWRGFYFITAFALNIFLARQLEARNSGLLFFTVNAYTLVLMLLSFGMEAAVGYFAAKKESLQLRLLNFSLLASIVIATAAALIILIMEKFDLADEGAGTPLIFAVCFVSGNFLLGCASVLFYAREDFVLPNLLSSFLNIGLIFFLLQDPSFYDVQAVYFIGFAVLALLTLFAFYLRHAKNEAGGMLSQNELRDLYRYSLRAYLGNLLFFLLYRVDYWFVEKYCSGPELGNYIQVSKLAQMFFVIPGILASAVLPYTASGKREEVKDILTKLCRSLLVVYGLVCLFLVITGKFLFPWLYGESFENMYYPFVFLVPGILGLSGLFTLTAYYAGKNRLRVNLAGAVIALIVILAGDTLFIPRYGINAAAIVSSAGYLAYHFYVLSIFSKEYNIPISEFFKIKISDLASIIRIIKRSEKPGHEIKQ